MNKRGFDDAWEWLELEAIRIGQDRREIGAACQWVSWNWPFFAGPRVFAEIGCDEGASAFVYADLLAVHSLATVILIDDLSRAMPTKGPVRVVEALRNEDFRVHLVPHPSQSQEALDALESVLGTDSIDILHIDGCHEYENVKADYLRYVPFVKRGGIVLLHDIGGEKPGPLKLWNEIAGPTVLQKIAFVSDASRGIGLVQVDPKVGSVL